MKKKSQPRREPIDAMVAALERIADALERNMGSNSGPDRTFGARSTIETKVRAAKGEEPDLTAMLTFNELRDYLGGRPKNPGDLPVWRGKVGGAYE
jgi:hypothetical protein